MMAWAAVFVFTSAHARTLAMPEASGKSLPEGYYGENGLKRRVVKALASFLWLMRRTRQVWFPVMVILMVATLAPGTSLATSAPSSLPRAKESVVFTIGSPKVVIDGQDYVINTPPYIDQNGRAMLPVRYVADVLGASSVLWDNASQDVQLQFAYNNQLNGAYDYQSTIEMKIGKPEYRVFGTWAKNGQVGATGSKSWIPMDTAAQIIYPGRVMLPVRVIVEALCDQINYDSINKTVTINIEPRPVQ